VYTIVGISGNPVKENPSIDIDISAPANAGGEDPERD
jgi:hypothetical protein